MTGRSFHAEGLEEGVSKRSLGVVVGAIGGVMVFPGLKERVGEGTAVASGRGVSIGSGRD
jgi:hypothetical protein